MLKGNRREPAEFEKKGKERVISSKQVLPFASPFLFWEKWLDPIMKIM
jgi:hypothetical protein